MPRLKRKPARGDGEFRFVPRVKMAGAAGESIQRAQWIMKLATELLHADPRRDGLAGVRIVENDAELARGFSKVHAIEAECLTLARSEVHAHQRRGALLILRVQQPAAIGAHAWPVFIGLSKRDLPRAFQRTTSAGVWIQREMPKIVVSNAAIRDHERATPFGIPTQPVNAARPARDLLWFAASRSQPPQIRGRAVVASLFTGTILKRGQQ